MRGLFGVSLILTVVFAVGCSARPVVKYEPVATGDETGKIKFVLPRSLFIVNKKVSQAEDGTREARLVATSVPTDLPIEGQPPEVYAMIPRDQIGVRTHLKVTYIDNSRIISSVGVEVEDNRVKTIAEVGGAVVLAVGVLAADVAKPADIPDHLPVVIDPKTYERESAGNRIWLPLPTKEGQWVYRLDIEPFPKDAIKTGEFFQKYGRDTAVLPFSACRDATLYMLNGAGKKQEEYDEYIDKAWVFGLKIADPLMVLTVELPPKGKVDMHPGCGANVTNEKTETASTWALIGEVMKQASALKKAYDAAKEEKVKKQR